MSWLREMRQFLRATWWNVLLFPPAAVAITWIHEQAHAVSARSFGATVESVAMFPGDGSWGHMTYVLPDGAAGSADFWVSLAPYLLGVSASLFGGLLASFARLPSPGRAFVFIWGAVVPSLEPAYGFLGWIGGGECDFRSALGPAGAMGLPSAIAFACFVAGWLWWVQRRALEPPLSTPSFAALALLTWGALLAVSDIPALLL